MKKFLFTLAACALAFGAAHAQKVTAPEPEFINSYCVLTSDSTFDILPKEDGKIEKHQSKFSKFSKIAGAVGDLGFAGAMLGANAGSISGVMTGAKVMGTAASAEVAANAVHTLAGVEGMDIVFSGATSAYSIKDASKGVRLLIKGGNNEEDPMGIYRIVRFKTSKKDRRIQWKEFKSSLIGSSETKKRGYVAFTGHKYGTQSYLLDIPASEVEPGEYGIFYMSIVTATEVPVGTFNVAM